MVRPVTKIEIAFNVGVTGTPVWTDVTSKVKQDPGISIEHWRGDEEEETQESRCSLVLLNSDGRYTPGNTASTHYPNIKRNRPIRIRSTHHGVTYDRFTGYIDDWAVEWPYTVSTVSECTVSASSRMARLARGVELKSLIEEEVALDGPIAHYTLGEAEGATRANDTSGNAHNPMLRSSSGVTFGTGTGATTDGLPAIQLTPGTSDVDPRLSASFPLTAASATLSIFFAAAPGNTNPALRPLRLYAGNDYFGLNVVASTVEATLNTAAGGSAPLVSEPASLLDGEVHHLAAVFTAGATATIELYVDGVSIGTDGEVGAVLPTFDRLRVGPWKSDSGTEKASLAHAVVFDRALTAIEVANHATAGLTGYADETSADRLARYATYAGIDPADTDLTGTTPIAHIDVTGMTALEAMRKVETTEGGTLFDALDGTLTFRGRDDRYGATSAFTASVSAREVSAPPRPVLDDQLQVNDMTATNAAGVVARSFDQTSIDDNGHYRDSVDLSTSDPDEPLSRAGWIVNRYAELAERISSLDVLLNTASNTLVGGVLTSQVGTKFTLSGLPSNAPASSMSLFIEGRTEVITMEEDRVSLHTSPAGIWDVWTLNSATLSQLGSTTTLAY